MKFRNLLMASRSSAFILSFSTGLALCFILAFKNTKEHISVNVIKPVQAHKAIDFLNSIGVNSAISTRGESLHKTIDIINYTGIRWIRSGYEGGIPIEDFIKLHKQTGLRFSYGLLSGGTDIPKLLKGARQLSAAGALLAFEGPNEPNNWGINYQGKSGGRDKSWLAVAALQKDLYQAVKHDPELKHYPVWSLSENGAETDNVGLQFLKIPQDANTLMPKRTAYADFANCHNYFSHPSHPGLYDNQTWNAASPGEDCKVDGLYSNYGITWRNHLKGYTQQELNNLPRVTTETGVTIHDEFTEEKQACLYLNLYLDQYKRHWSYTAVYLLRDRTDEAGNQQFGFYKPDYSPRKAAIYLHNLTTILADNQKAGQTGELAYIIPNEPATVHDMLLQKGNGNFELVVWDERVNGANKINVRFGQTYGTIKVYDPTTAATAVKNLRETNIAELNLTDHPVIVEIPAKQ